MKETLRKQQWAQNPFPWYSILCFLYNATSFTNAWVMPLKLRAKRKILTFILNLFSITLKHGYTKLGHAVIESSLKNMTKFYFIFLFTTHLVVVKIKILIICVKIWKDKLILVEN